jgi:DNA invertase Pin-like site-specific DNA recombinase
VTEEVITLRRVSDDSQDSANQKQELEQHCASRGYSVVREFVLDDVSGSKGHWKHEAALEEICQLLEMGVATCLLVVHSSRLDRRTEDEQIELLLRIRKAGARVESVREPAYGKTDMASRIVTQLAQLANAQYSRDLSAHVKAGNARIRSEGYFTGGRVPWGYATEGERRKKRLIPGPDAETVRKAFELAAAGKTMPEIRAALKITRNNGALTWALRNDTYWRGAYSHGNGIHRCEPLVSHAVWKAANDALDARPATNPHGRQPKREDFSGSLYCEQGHKIYRAYSHGRRMYRCRDCKLNWDSDVVDATVQAKMAGDGWPEADLVVIPGNDTTEALERVLAELDALPRRRLSRREEQAERERLWAEQDRLEAMPAVPVRRELRFTGRSMGDAWQSWSHAERIAYLNRGEFRLMLSADGTLRKDFLEDPDEE